MSYKVIKNDKQYRPNLWKANIEALIALLALEISNEKPQFKPENIVRELNYKYLRKKKKTLLKNCSATMLQRNIINKTGY